MDRLTTYKTECNREMICRYEDCDICEEYCPHLQEDNCSCLKEILEKLGQYEDAEEQGLLLRLPCPIGTPVYAVVSECEGDYYECYHDCDTCNNRHIYVVEEKFNLEYLDEIGKWIFPTKEEAEQALQKMKEGADNV